MSDLPERLLELLDKRLGDMTKEEFIKSLEEIRFLTREYLGNLKSELKKEWGWTESDWQNSMSETSDYDEDIDVT